MAKVLKNVQVTISAEVAVDNGLDDTLVLRFAIPSLVENIRGLKVDEFCIEKRGEVAPDPLNTKDRNFVVNHGKRRLIGYQIVSDDSACSIPSRLYSFIVLSEKAVKEWWKYEKRHPTGSWKTVPVYAGEIEDPVIITSLNSLYD